MTFYFIGGEDHDFSKIGAVSIDTISVSTRRAANARCTLKVGPSAGLTDGWYANLNSVTSELWTTVRSYNTSNIGIAGQDLISFTDGAIRRLVLTTNAGGSGTTKISLIKRNAANTDIVLGTASINVTAHTLLKFDIYIDYSVTGTVNVYQDGTLILSYSGDVTTDAAATIDGLVLGNYSSGSQYWSEIIVANTDTRGLSCITMAPEANGNVFEWSNSFANIDEIVLDDSDLIATEIPNLIAQTTITKTGLAGNLAVLAVGISARGQRGLYGVTNLQFGVRTNSVNHFSSTKELDIAPSRVHHIWAQNPDTADNWSIDDLKSIGFNIGVKSIA